MSLDMYYQEQNKEREKENSRDGGEKKSKKEQGKKKNERGIAVQTWWFPTQHPPYSSSFLT